MVAKESFRHLIILARHNSEWIFAMQETIKKYQFLRESNKKKKNLREKVILNGISIQNQNQNQNQTVQNCVGK